MSGIFKRNRMKGKFFYRLLTFFMLFVPLMFIVSIFSYYNIMENLENEKRYRNSVAVSSIADAINRELGEVERMFSIVAKSLKSLSGLNSKKSYSELLRKNFSEMDSIITSLNRIEGIKASVTDTAIHFVVNDFIITGSSVYTYNDYFERFYVYENLSPDYMRSLNKGNSYMNILPPDVLKKPFSGNAAEQVIPIAFCYKTTESLMVNILVNLKKTYLQRTLSAYAYKGTSIYAVDNAGTILSSAGENTLNAGAAVFETLGEVKNGATKKIGDRDMVVFSGDISRANWKVYSFVPKNEFEEESRIVLMNILLINVLLLSLALGLSFYFSNLLYHPITNLMTLMDGSIAQKPKKPRLFNEIDYIASNFQTIRSSNSELSDRARRLSRYAQDGIIRSMIMSDEGAINEAEILDLFKDEEIKLRGKCFVLSVCRLLYSKSFYADFEENSQEMIKDGVMTVIKGSIQGRYDDSVFINLGLHSLIILNNSDETELREEIVKIVGSINDMFAQDAMYIKMMVCIGNRVEGLRKLPSEYTACFVALENCPIRESGHIVPQRAQPKDMESAMPINLTDKLMNLIGNRNLEAVLSYIEETFDAAYDASFSAVDFRKLARLTCNACERAAYKYKVEDILSNRAALEQELEQALDDWDFYGAMAALRKWLGHHVSQVRGESPEDKKRAAFQEYIMNNYMNVNLSLEYMADEIGLHRNYLSRIFKDVMERTFTDYVSSLRIGKACELLEKTDLPIEVVMRQVGIDSRATFNRLFNRYTGISPATYRLAKK